MGCPKAFPSPILIWLSVGLGAGKGHSMPGHWHQGKGRRDGDSQDLCCQRRSEERRETAKVRDSAAKIHNESAGALEGRD